MKRSVPVSGALVLIGAVVAVVVTTIDAKAVRQKFLELQP